jgi:hypothetical protein
MKLNLCPLADRTGQRQFLKMLDRRMFQSCRSSVNRIANRVLPLESL